MSYIYNLDKQILIFVNDLQYIFLDTLALGIGWITEGGLIWLILCFLILLFDKVDKKRKVILLLATLLMSSWLVRVPLIPFYFRTRPYEALEGIRVIGKTWENSSFPSGHVAASVAALIVIFYLYRIRNKWLIISAIIFIIVLGFARIYVGMHYPTDILGGILFGTATAAVIIWIDKQIIFIKNRKEVDR
jgi:undecaprenyl-diphosphatase